MARKTAAAKKLDDLAPVVERPKSKRGRPAVHKAGMEALVNNWGHFTVGETRALPDRSGSSLHADVTLERYHFSKYAKKAGLSAGTDYTIETSEDGAVITRLQ